MNPKDPQRLIAAYRELAELADAGKITEADYARIYAEASDAAGDYGFGLEGIVMRGVQLGFVKR